MIEFPLEEWEWPPDVERRYLVEPFQSECLAHFGITRLIACAVPLRIKTAPYQEVPLLFFRPEEWLAELDLPWFKLASGVSVPNYVIAWSWALSNPTAAPTQESIEDTLTRGVGYDFSGVRYFSVAQGQCYLFADYGRWYESDDPTDIWENPTFFRLPAGLHGQSSAAIYGWLNEQLADFDSELAFAARWHNLPFPQIREILESLVPQMAQWRRVMQAVANIEALAPLDHFHWYLTPGGPPDESPAEACDESADEPVISQISYHPRGDATTESQLNARLLLWGQLLQQHFPFPTLDEESLPHCLYHTYRQQTSRLHIFHQPISAHERLETVLFLREWLQDKTTPAEIERLLPPV